VWEIRPERARRVGHPAPFPVELPERFIRLYTYADDVVLDPFLGSGSTAVAAVRNDRRYVGYDTDAEYIALAEARVEDARRLVH
jgi:site-specific DNA-methyltransferase (adenine-specific)